MSTVQQIADYWAWQVEIGRGQWEARLDPRGALGLPGSLPANTVLSLSIPEDGETCDKRGRVVFGAARLSELKE